MYLETSKLSQTCKRLQNASKEDTVPPLHSWLSLFNYLIICECVNIFVVFKNHKDRINIYLSEFFLCEVIFICAK